LEITISIFLGSSNIVAYNPNAFEQYNKNVMIIENYIVVLLNPENITQKTSMFNSKVDIAM
jgi:hypothetical protein